MYYYVRYQDRAKDRMKNVFALIVIFISLSGCMKKFADPEAVSYAGQDSLYCNDPAAINYNHEFPGTADNTTCIFPTDVFVGAYSLIDSVFTPDYASFYVIEDTINIYALSKTKLAVVGYCGPYDSIKLTAGRYYKATIDTTIGNGQALCSIKDTISGIFSVDATERVRVNFTLGGDTAGIKYHRGTATPIQ
jgi:hypothetical protein